MRDTYMLGKNNLLPDSLILSLFLDHCLIALGHVTKLVVFFGGMTPTVYTFVCVHECLASLCYEWLL